MGLQQELAKSLGVKPKIRWGGTGLFDVIVDGAMVYSTQKAGKIPTAGEIVDRVEQS